MKHFARMKPFDYILYGLVIFGWSTSWLPLKWQLGVVAPEVSLFWRFALSAVLMFIITAALKRPLTVPLSQHVKIMGLGLCLFSANFTLFYYGGMNATSGLLAVVFSCASMINIFLMALLFHQRPKTLMVIAACFGFAGVGFMYAPQLAAGSTHVSSLLLCLSGTAFFCFGNLLSSRIQADGVHVLTANCWGMMYGVVILFIISQLRGHSFHVEWTYQYLGGMLWLAVISSVIAFSAYLALLGRIGPGRAGYATVIFPVGALLISTVMEGYQWGILAVLGLGFVLIGNVMMIKSR